VDQIAKLTGLDREVVEAVLKGQELLLYNQARLQNQEDPNSKYIDLEIPHVGTLRLFRVNYHKRDDVRNNAALRAKIYPSEAFRNNMRLAVFEGKDFLTEHVLDKFKNTMLNKFRSLL